VIVRLQGGDGGGLGEKGKERSRDSVGSSDDGSVTGDETDGEVSSTDETAEDERMEDLRIPTSPDPPTLVLDALSLSSSSDGEGFSSFIKAYR
jgi:hypothetical protein